MGVKRKQKIKTHYDVEISILSNLEKKKYKGHMLIRIDKPYNISK